MKNFPVSAFDENGDEKAICHFKRTEDPNYVEMVIQNHEIDLNIIINIQDIKDCLASL